MSEDCDAMGLQENVVEKVSETFHKIEVWLKDF